jgi:hypothetical protein
VEHYTGTPKVRAEEEVRSRQHLVSRHLMSHWTFGYESHQTFSMVPGDGTEVLGIYI